MLRRYTFRRVYTVHRSSGFDIVSINSSHCLGIHNGFLGEAWIYIIQSFVLKEESFNVQQRLHLYIMVFMVNVLVI